MKSAVGFKLAFKKAKSQITLTVAVGKTHQVRQAEVSPFPAIKYLTERPRFPTATTSEDWKKSLCIIVCTKTKSKKMAALQWTVVYDLMGEHKVLRIKKLSLIPNSPGTLHSGDICEMSLQDFRGFITGLKHSLFSGNCHAGLQQETKVIPGLPGEEFCACQHSLCTLGRITLPWQELLHYFKTPATLHKYYYYQSKKSEQDYYNQKNIKYWSA